MTEPHYTTQLQAGLGMIEETNAILDLWDSGMATQDVVREALDSGRFPNRSARRLRNLVAECFAPRYLVRGGQPAQTLKIARERLATRALSQLMFLFTCRASEVLGDFVRDVYWPAYSAGRDTLGISDAKEFVLRANQDGKTAKAWADSTITRVSGYLIGACADFGLLESTRKKSRRILPYKILPQPAAILAYDLHYQGYGDNRVVSCRDWQLFGMEHADVIDQLKRLAMKGVLIVQAAGDVVRIGWQCKDMKELIDAVAEV